MPTRRRVTGQHAVLQNLQAMGQNPAQLRCRDGKVRLFINGCPRYINDFIPIDAGNPIGTNGIRYVGSNLAVVDTAYNAPGDMTPGGNLMHEPGHAAGLPEANNPDGTLRSGYGPNNFMLQGIAMGSTPNRDVTAYQCAKLREFAVPVE